MLEIELFVINISGCIKYKKEEFDFEKKLLESKYNKPTPYEIIADSNKSKINESEGEKYLNKTKENISIINILKDNDEIKKEIKNIIINETKNILKDNDEINKLIKDLIKNETTNILQENSETAYINKEVKNITNNGEKIVIKNEEKNLNNESNKKKYYQFFFMFKIILFILLFIIIGNILFFVFYKRKKKYQNINLTYINKNNIEDDKNTLRVK